jgi:hypothetical protein
MLTVGCGMLLEAQEARELANLAVLEQGLCKRDADDPACKRFSFPDFSGCSLVCALTR